jgi:hypothetical protein
MGNLSPTRASEKRFDRGTPGWRRIARHPSRIDNKQDVVEAAE